jgi:hypothetical protein
MKKLLLGLSALPFLIEVATAAESLSDRKMDGISAGDTPGVFSTSASMSTDGRHGDIEYRRDDRRQFHRSRIDGRHSATEYF